MRAYVKKTWLNISTWLNEIFTILERTYLHMKIPSYRIGKVLEWVKFSPINFLTFLEEFGFQNYEKYFWQSALPSILKFLLTRNLKKNKEISSRANFWRRWVSPLLCSSVYQFIGAKQFFVNTVRPRGFNFSIRVTFRLIWIHQSFGS